VLSQKVEKPSCTISLSRKYTIQNPKAFNSRNLFFGLPPSRNAHQDTLTLRHQKEGILDVQEREIPTKANMHQEN
jgi:hypothetical protein